MSTIVNEYHWHFNRTKFANDMRKWRDNHELTKAECNALLGRENLWHNWESNAPSQQSYHPLMTSFLDICNLCDFDARDYWYISRANF